MDAEHDDGVEEANTLFDAPDPADPSETGGASVTADLDVRQPRAARLESSEIGRYTVIRTLGEGGMGVVYLAYDERLDRRVAVKLLRESTNADAQRRLEREAQAMARLSHPNVVTVHEVGTHDGQVYVAMEFVEGRDLKTWLGDPDRGWREVLDVFRQAGEGLAAAHDAGLVHRDFKPDNVLIGDDGRVRVADFGLAHGLIDAIEDEPSAGEVQASQLLTEMTRTGALMGTPAYMSPEQFAGRRSDARGDQFSFCVALWEGLYGARPFSGRGLAELSTNITEGRIDAPPDTRGVPSWLRAIVERGLSTNADARWPSMRALLDALADDPGIRRRRWLGAALILGLLGGSGWAVASTIQADARRCAGMDAPLVGVWDDGRRAEVEAAILGTELSYAGDTWERVEPELDRYARAWVEARVDACEASHTGEQSSELLDRRMVCLDGRLSHLRATIAELANADETVVAKAVQAVAELPRLSHCADADALLAEVQPPEDPEVARRVADLEAQLVEAQAKQSAGKYAEGLALANAVVEASEALDYEPLRARAWLRQGAMQLLDGAYEDAEATLKRALDAAVVQRMMPEAARASSTLVWLVGYRQERLDEGRRWAELASAWARADGSPEAWAEHLHNLGAIAMLEGRYDDARRHHEEALAIFEAALGPGDPRLARTLTNLADNAVLAGNYAEARTHYERALATQEAALGPSHPQIGFTLNGYGNVAMRDSQPAEARELLERALAIRERALGPEHPDVASTLLFLGFVAKQQGDYAEAYAMLERALVIHERTYGPRHSNVAGALSNLGTVAMAEGDYPRARAYFERTLAIAEAVFGPEHPSVASTLVNLGLTSRREGDYAQARRDYARALAIQEKVLGPDHVNVSVTLVNTGYAAYAAGEYAEAVDLYRRGLKIQEAALGEDHVDVADTLGDLGSALNALGEHGRSRECLERALRIRASHGAAPGDHPGTQFELAKALWSAPAEQGGDRERALAVARIARDAYADGSEDRREVEDWLRASGER